MCSRHLMLMKITPETLQWKQGCGREVPGCFPGNHISDHAAEFACSANQTGLWIIYGILRGVSIFAVSLCFHFFTQSTLCITFTAAVCVLQLILTHTLFLFVTSEPHPNVVYPSTLTSSQVVPTVTHLLWSIHLCSSCWVWKVLVQKEQVVLIRLHFHAGKIT